MTDLSKDGLPLGIWLRNLAAKSPTPGGGAVAALQAATAAALASMVAAYTTGTRWADRESTMLKVQQSSSDSVEKAISLIEADEMAFAAVGYAYALPKETEDEIALRLSEIERVLIEAAKPPSQVGRLAADLLPNLALLADQGNRNVISDVAVAAVSAKSAIDSAIVNIVVNARLIKSKNERERLLDLVEELTVRARDAQEIASAVTETLRP